MTFDATTQGSVVAALVGIIAFLLKKVAGAAKQRPVYENGKLAEVQQMLEALKISQGQNRDTLQAQINGLRHRILELENGSEEGNREHSRLWNRLAELERR